MLYRWWAVIALVVLLGTTLIYGILTVERLESTVPGASTLTVGVVQGNRGTALRGVPELGTVEQLPELIAEHAIDELESVRGERLAFDVMSKDGETKLASAGEKLLKKVEADIQPKHRARFLRLLESKQGQALSEVIDGSCSLCHFALRPHLQQRVRRSEEIIDCEHCHRILYVEEVLVARSADAVDS